MIGTKLTRTINLLMFMVVVMVLLAVSASYYDEGHYQDAVCWLLFTIAVALLGLIIDRLIEAQQ